MRSLTFCLFALVLRHCGAKYEPTWPSLDGRASPPWYDEAKIGILIDWGVYSVPSYKSPFFWHDWRSLNDSDIVQYMKRNYKPDFTYADFAADFKAEFFDAAAWGRVVQASGAK